MNVLTIGCGYIGSVLANELIKSLDINRLIICDSERSRISEIAQRLGSKVQPINIQLSEYSNLIAIIDEADIVVGLSPGRIGYNVMKACVENGKNLVDLSYMPEDPFLFHKDAVDRKMILIPDCGVAPGLSNILIGKAAAQLDEIDDVNIYVGGLPVKPKPPLNYKVTWCIEDLFEEYTRRARIVRNGKRIEVDALKGNEDVEFKGKGVFEAFFTDGVRTLHHTIPAKNMWEKTLRYKGHAKKIRFLKEMGLLNKTVLNTINFSPWEFMIKFWEKNLGFIEEEDFVAMRIRIRGRRNSTTIERLFEMIEYFDTASNITAMGRTTAYTAFAIIKLLVENKIEKKGVIPPEILGMNKELYNEILSTLKERNITVKEKLVK